MDPDLDFKGCVTVLLVNGEVEWGDKRNGLVGSFGAEDIAKRDVFEAMCLPDIVVARVKRGVSGAFLRRDARYDVGIMIRYTD